MAAKGYFNPTDEDQKQPTPPSMARSRSQLAGSYAPGAFFTFEGGLGACIAIPDQGQNPQKAQISEETQSQIIIRLQDIWQSWFSEAYGGVTRSGRTIDPRLCIDEVLLAGGTVKPLAFSQMEFVNPLRMGYEPAPLTFVCNNCGLFRKFDNVTDFGKTMGVLSQDNCKNPKGKEQRKCQWRQLDVIFVHWSGEWQPAQPGMYEWSDRTNEVRINGEKCQMCESISFSLNTTSPRIGEWGFSCASCGNTHRANWLQNDRFTTSVLQQDSNTRPQIERRMQAVSYRATSAYYVQWDQFVVFSREDETLLSYLHEGREDDLKGFIAKQYGYGGSLPGEEEMRDILLQGGHAQEWQSYEGFKKLRDLTQDAGAKGFMDREMQKLVKRWMTQEPVLIEVKSELPVSIAAVMQRRNEFGGRYDPFVLSVEHESLMRSRILKTTALGERARFVRFYQLDIDLAPKDAEKKAEQETRTLELMTTLGFEELGLIREFELCRFTHGYTRVGDMPTLEKNNITMPVRLRLFEQLGNHKWPIYVVNQDNEAIYVRLKPELVYKWLMALQVVDLPAWDPTGAVMLGGPIIESAEPFGRYFALLNKDAPKTYRYIYTLLHSYSHLFMKSVAEFSGLDLGSLGEYLFPADLAFVVYRNGVTMDLGNLSSLWRNENNRFLAHLLEPSSHRCNSGSLCDFHGGACPDCLMVPETSCVAGNQLLSRAVICGGVAPREDLPRAGKRIPGFIEVVNSGA